MKRVLLTTIHRPLGIESETCTKNIQAELYHAQVTFEQGPFSIRAVCTGWGIEFIAANLDTPTTVLHYPTKRLFVKELKKGYEYVGISFVICTFPKAKELCELVRREAPGSKIVLGGYGTLLEECESFADFVCREEGVNFFKRLLGKENVETFKVPVIRRSIKVMSVSSQPEGIVPVGLGPSVFRILEVQLMAYEFLKDSPHPLFRIRAREHRRLCLEIYPLLKTGIKKAPSNKVKEYLKDLRDRIENHFRISAFGKVKESIAPLFYLYTQWHDRLFPHKQPHTEIHRYNF
jgi:hypothetical protein